MRTAARRARGGGPGRLSRKDVRRRCLLGFFCCCVVCCCEPRHARTSCPQHPLCRLAPRPAGRGTLAQLGLGSPSPELLTALLALTGAGLVLGTANTANRLVNKKMSPK